MNRLVFLIAPVFVSAAWAQAPATKPCKFEAMECAAFDRYQAQEARVRAEQRQNMLREDARFQAERKAERETKQAEMAAARAQDQADRAARVKARDQAREAEDRAEAMAAQRVARVETAKKQRCGDDYHNIRIGMAVERVIECVSASFKRSGQTNTAQGLITTYKAPRGFFHAIDGRVVQWGKFD